MAERLPEDATPRDAQEVHSGQDARQGEIILRNRGRRLIFIGGLVALVVLAAIVRCAGYA